MADFVVIFKAKLHWKSTSADQTSVFNLFLTEVIICFFNNNTLKK